MSRLVGTKGRVYAFEPDPENFSLLERNTRHLRNVVLERTALSDHGGEIVLHHIQGSSGCHTILPTKDATSIAVPTDTLDHYVEKNGISRVNFIKMDIEGAEPVALRGMEHMLLNMRGLRIVMEGNPEALRASGIDAEEFLRDIARRGFSIRTIETYQGKQRFMNVILEKKP